MKNENHKGNEKLHVVVPYSFDELLDCSEDGFSTLSRRRLAVTPPHEISELLDRLSVEEKHTVLKKLSQSGASDVIAEMDAEDSAEIINEMHDLRAVQIIESLEPDDAANVLRELPDDDRERLLNRIPVEIADTLRSLLKYAPDTAGGVMTPYVTTIQANMSASDALNFLRERREDTENLESIYVLDNEKHLVGVLGLRKLLWAAPDRQISQVMEFDIQGACSPEQDKESVAQMMAELHYHNLPVLDSQRRLLGIITHDDVIDILREEATEDLQKMHGAGGDETIHDAVRESLLKRFPWLLINLVVAFLTSKVVSLFKDAMHQITILAVFMNLTSSLGGNAGAQTLAVAIRSFALDEFKDADAWGVLMREMLKGLINGVIIGVIAAIGVSLWEGSCMLGVVVFLAMISSMTIAGFAGALVPIGLKKYNFDPAQSSYMILTTVTDMVGMVLFLSIGAFLLL